MEAHTIAAELLKFLMSAAGGALIGGCFSLMNKVLDARSQARREAHEVELRRVDLDIMRVEFEGAAIARSNEPTAGLVESYAHDLKGGGKKAEVFRGLVRPMLTATLTLTAIGVNCFVMGLGREIWPNLTTTQQFAVFWASLDWVGFQSSTAITWWFGARGEHVKRG